MRYLEVQEDGSLVEAQELDLNAEKVLIVVDEDVKRMWLWKGSSCPIRKKFIGSRALSDLRKKEYGFAYIPQTCDQNDETAEFVAMTKKVNKSELVADNVVQRDVYNTRRFSEKPCHLILKQSKKLSGRKQRRSQRKQLFLCPKNWTG